MDENVHTRFRSEIKRWIDNGWLVEVARSERCKLVYLLSVVCTGHDMHHLVKFEDTFYKLRRLGFGLGCPPEIMKVVVSKVLSLDEKINAATDHYYDDIITSRK